MTLSSFKKHTKLTFFIGIFVLYGVGSYLLGNYRSDIKIPSLDKLIKVKGVSTKNSLVTPIDSPVPFSDTQSTSIISSYVKQCSNTKYGFEVSYPNDWFTTYNTEEDKCLYFAPYSFTLPGSLSGFSTPIKLEIAAPEDWDGVVKFYENPNDFQNVLSIKNIAINGAAVERVEAMTTGAGNSAKNFTKLSFLYSDSKLPVVLTYQQSDDKENAESYKRILEDMATSLKRF